MGFRLNSLGGAVFGLALGTITFSPVANAQSPSEIWRTLETKSFRFHYPEPAEAFTRRSAARMEAIRSAVAEQVGYAPERRTEVLVRDPLARANGSAWPLLTAPRMILYTTPPPADSVLGNYRDWGEILTVHEDVHLAHLLRPSRHPGQRLLETVIPLGPISQGAPGWVIEGYATLLEGRLTGWGRPYGSLRAALLRRWAQAGELPSYGSLSGDGRRWLGLSMPYLVGSAFLEWLERRAGEDALRHLWRRMTAAENRGFAAAFRGVFGDSPARLYNRFRAELTYRAMQLEQEIEPRLEVGELWQDLSWQPSVPTVDQGERVAIVLRRRDAPSRLVVWSTAEDDEAAQKLKERQAESLERDPQDVAARWPEVLPKKPLHVLETRHGAAPYSPRWAADGQWILFHRFEIDDAGDRRSDLFRWWPESGRVERLTRFADVRNADPSPDGAWAVGLRQRWGTSQLVKVDFESGVVEQLTEASVARVYDQPRLSPDGESIAYLVNEGGGWRLAVRSIGGSEKLLPIVVGDAAITGLNHPSWSTDGRELILSLGFDGFLDIFAVDVNQGSLRRLTRSHGAALAPAPSPSGAIYFLSLESDGFDLRRLPRRAVGPPLVVASTWSVERRREFVPAVPAAAPKIPPFELAKLSESTPYGAGPGEWLPLFGGALSADGSRVEAGARYGDLVGRLSVVALGSVADAGVEGGAVAAAWRGSRLQLEGRLFAFSRRPSRETSELGRIKRRGLELALGESGGSRLWRWRWRAGALLGEVETGEVEADEAGARNRNFDQRVAFAEASSSWGQSWGDFHLDERIRLNAAVGETKGSGAAGLSDGWERGEIDARGDLGYAPTDGPRLRLGLSWRRAKVSSAVNAFDRLRLGGSDDSLSPRSIAATAFYSAALPASVEIAENAEHQRIELGLGTGFSLFGERYRLWNEGMARADWLRLAGVRWSFSSLPFPLLAVPGVKLEAGAAVLLDPPFEDDVEGWLVIRWHP